MAALDVLSLAARIVVGATFLVAGWGKLRDIPAFVAGVRTYGLLPGTLVAPAAYLLLAAEFVLGAALLLGLGLPGSAVAAAGLATVFALAMTAVAVGGRDIPCLCFGVSDDHRVGPGAVLRSGLLALLCLLVACGPAGATPSALPPFLATADGVAALATSLAAVVVAVVLAEPVVLGSQGVVEAWRAGPALRAAEDARARRSCATPR